MLKRIILKNFFSFHKQTEIKLYPGLNILLGINGSGKTSAINALRLLYEGVAGIGFERLFQKLWGGYAQVVNFNGTQAAEDIEVTYVFDHEYLKNLNLSSPFKSEVFYRLRISSSGSSYTIEEQLYSDDKRGDGQFCYLQFKNGVGLISVRQGKGKVKNERYRNGELSGQELVLRQITDPQRFLPSFIIRKAVENMSLYGHFDTCTESLLRRPCEYSTDTRLVRHGENLVHLLNYLRNEHGSSYDNIEKALREVNPAYQSIEFRNFGSQLLLSIREKNLERTISSLHISDGTLRFLLLMSVFLNPQRGDLIALDEPEGGLHPDMISVLTENMKQAAQASQIILATHSPLLLNQFDLEDVIVFEKDQDNTSIVKYFTEEDFPDWEGEFLPGQMWVNGKIGAKRW